MCFFFQFSFYFAMVYHEGNLTLMSAWFYLSVGGLGCSERSADGSRRLRWNDLFKNDRSLRSGRQHMEVNMTKELGL